MYCTHCGKQVPDGAAFCNHCGAPMAGASQPPVEEEPQRPQPDYTAPADSPSYDTYAPNYGAYTPPQQDAPNGNACPPQQDAPAQGGYAAPDQPLEYAGPNQPGYGDYPAPEAPEKKKHTGLIVTLCVVSVVVVAAVALLVAAMTGILGGNGPLEDIVTAVDSTFLGDTLNMKMDITVEDHSVGEQITTTAAMDVDPANREIYTLIHMNDPTGESMTLAIHDGALLMDVNGQCMRQDISSELDEMWLTLDEARAARGDEERDWEEFLREFGLYDTLEGYIDFDKFDPCMETLVEHLNDETWLEENAGYTESKKRGVTLYEFDIPFYDFLSAVLEDFEPCFLDSSNYEEFRSELHDVRSEMDGVKLVLSVGIEDDLLHSIGMKFTVDGDSGSVDIEFSDIGSTTVDQDAIDDMIQRAIS